MDTTDTTSPDPRELAVSVTSAADRPTRNQQIAQLVRLVPDQGTVKVRFPVQIYDEKSKQYTTLREAQWTLGIPKELIDSRTVPQLLEVFDLVMKRMGSHGADYIHELITRHEMGQL
jgi:hypothetical protein